MWPFKKTTKPYVRPRGLRSHRWWQVVNALERNPWGFAMFVVFGAVTLGLSVRIAYVLCRSGIECWERESILFSGVSGTWSFWLWSLSLASPIFLSQQRLLGKANLLPRSVGPMLGTHFIVSYVFAILGFLFFICRWEGLGWYAFGAVAMLSGLIAWVMEHPASQHPVYSAAAPFMCPALLAIILMLSFRTQEVMEMVHWHPPCSMAALVLCGVGFWYLSYRCAKRITEVEEFNLATFKSNFREKAHLYTRHKQNDALDNRFERLIEGLIYRTVDRHMESLDLRNASTSTWRDRVALYRKVHDVVRVWPIAMTVASVLVLLFLAGVLHDAPRTSPQYLVSHDRILLLLGINWFPLYFYFLFLFITLEKQVMSELFYCTSRAKFLFETLLARFLNYLNFWWPFGVTTGVVFLILSYEVLSLQEVFHAMSLCIIGVLSFFGYLVYGLSVQSFFDLFWVIALGLACIVTFFIFMFLGDLAITIPLYTITATSLYFWIVGLWRLPRMEIGRKRL